MMLCYNSSVCFRKIPYFGNWAEELKNQGLKEEKY